MRVLVVGGGAREHALVWKLHFSPLVSGIYAAPGNAGIAFLARAAPISAEDIPGLFRFALENSIDLTVVGPEGPLAGGIVDRFQAAGLRIFGPTQSAARIESSKVWAKDLMRRYGIPTARWTQASSADEARAAVREWGFPLVLKADGLAGGKGAVVCRSLEDAEAVIDEFMVRGALGQAGQQLVVEEFLEGQELSVFALADGAHTLPLIAARDYKPLLDDDQGPNTGGMGGYTQPRYAGPELMDEVHRTVLEPVVQAMSQEGCPYVGVLYAGLMITREGPKVLEFNCRWGDPEAQLLLPLLQTDLVELMQACLEDRLQGIQVAWRPEHTCAVVLAARGYPTGPVRGDKIEGLDDIEDGVLVFHAATRALDASRRGWLQRQLRSTMQADLGLMTNGGRVLTVVAQGPTLAEARAKAYANVERIHFEGMQYRRDIAASDPTSEEIRQAAGDGRRATARVGADASVGPALPRTQGRRRKTASPQPRALSPQPSAVSPQSSVESVVPHRQSAIRTPQSAVQPSPQSSTAADPQPLTPSPHPPAVAVLMGSESDRGVMEETLKALDSLGISSEVHVMSAHRTPERVRQFARTAESRGIRVLIAGAGGAAHLPGVLAAQTTLPVIGVPIASGSLMGLDSLLSIAQMPGGVPVATMAVGSGGARNAAYFAAAIIGTADEEVRTRYRQYRIDQSGGELASP